MKQAKLNSTILLSKYEDMRDTLDLNSVTKARQINLRLSSLPTINYKSIAIISFYYYMYVLLCSGLVKTIYTYNCHFPWSMISVLLFCKCMLCDWLGHQIIVSVAKVMIHI